MVIYITSIRVPVLAYRPFLKTTLSTNFHWLTYSWRVQPGRGLFLPTLVINRKCIENSRAQLAQICL